MGQFECVSMLLDLGVDLRVRSCMSDWSDRHRNADRTALDFARDT